MTVNNEKFSVQFSGYSIVEDEGDTYYVFTYVGTASHYFATVFTDDGDVVYLGAALPEKLCVSGAEYTVSTSGY